MKTMLLILATIVFCCSFPNRISAQNSSPWPKTGSVGIGTATPNPSAILDVDTVGMGILIPRMTRNQRDAIAAPATGLLIFQTNNTPGFYYYSGAAWVAVAPKGVNKTLSNLSAPTAINQGLQPDIDNGRDLGTNTYRWRDIYFSRNLTAGDKVVYRPYPSATNNEAFGFSAGPTVTSGANNTFFGSRAGQLTNTGSANTGTGAYSLSANTTGNGNTANGYRALSSNINADYNTATGFQSLYINSAGISNTANGAFALNSNSTGNFNTANGVSALYTNNTGNSNTVSGGFGFYFNTTGSFNIGMGNYAGGSNTTGSHNVFIGNYAGYKNTTTSYQVAIGDSASYNYTGSAIGNIAIGYKTLFANTDGYNNVGMGFETLATNTTGTSNTAIGSEALYANTTGNENTATGSATLKNNSIGKNNTGMGSAALFNNTTGSNNAAFGYTSNAENTTGSYNTAIGVSALYSNTAGSDLVAVGDSALYFLNGGLGGNTAVGSKAGKKITTGNYSTYIGWKSGYNGTTANANTAVGASSLFSNTTGYDNIAMGVDALSINNTGSYNSVIGKGAGTSNTSGSGNASVGVRSLYLNTSGARNTAIGDSAGYSNTTGNTNTFLGAFSDATTGGLINATAIGYNAKVAASYNIVLGDATPGVGVAIGSTAAGSYKLKVSHGNFGFDLVNAASGNNWEQYVTNSTGSTVGGANFGIGDLLLYYNAGSPVGAFDHTSGAYKTTSDERMKTNIKSMPSILDKINQLEPVTYNFKNGDGKLTSMGFIAQKVEKLFPAMVTHYVDTARGTDVNLMDYTGFGVIAIKGIQELQQVVKDKDAKIDAQQKQIDDLKSMMMQLQQSVQALQSCSPCSNAKSAIQNPSSVILSNDAASLEQNIPNPFPKTTIINYTLPQKFIKAQLIITDNTGKILKEVNLPAGAGKGSLKLDAATLPSGAYHYSLMVDGTLFNTKQMIVTK